MEKAILPFLKKNDKLNYFISYLETNPSEQYLKSEKDKIQRIISSKTSRFDYWSENVCSQEILMTKRRALFDKEVGINDLKKRLKTMNYILS